MEGVLIVKTIKGLKSLNWKVAILSLAGHCVLSIKSSTKVNGGHLIWGPRELLGLR